MAEQLADREVAVLVLRTVDGNERLALRLAEEEDGLREQFLARAALAGNQHRLAVAGDLLQFRQRLEQVWRVADELERALRAEPLESTAIARATPRHRRTP